jgi:hypothetical protein
MIKNRVIGIELVVDDKGTVKLIRFARQAKQAFGQAGRSADDLGDSMKKGAQQAKRAEGAMAQVERRAGSLTGKVKLLGGAFERLRQAGGMVWGTIRRIAGGMFSLKGALVGLGLGVALGNVAKSFLDAASETENYTARLTSLLGSQKAATQAIQFYQKVASKVPFTLREVVESGTALEAFGAKSQKWLKPLTDLAAVMGVDLPEAAQALGRAYAGGAGAADIFRERGILQIIKDFAKLKYGIEDITKLTLPQFRRVMFEVFTQADGRIAGAADRQAKTWKGMISMLEDAWYQFRQKVMEAGVFDWLKAQLQSVLDWIEDAKASGKFQEWAQAIGSSVTKAFNTVKTWLAKGKVWWQEYGEDVKTVISGVVSAINEMIKAIAWTVDVLEKAARLSNKYYVAPYKLPDLFKDTGKAGGATGSWEDQTPLNLVAGEAGAYGGSPRSFSAGPAEASGRPSLLDSLGNDAKAIARIEKRITDQVAKATLDRYELRERELDQMVAGYKKAGGDVSKIEADVNKLRVKNYTDYVNRALKEERKKSEALGRGALKLGKADEQAWRRKEQGERALREKLRLLGLRGTELELERLRMEVEGYEQAGYDKELIAAYTARRLEEINQSALDQVLADWADGAGNMKRVTADAFNSMRSMLSNDLTRFFKGEFDSIGDLWRSLMDNMLNMFAQLVSQILVIWGTSNVARLFTGDPYLPLFGGVLDIGGKGGGPVQTAGTAASIYSAGKSILAGLGLIGPTTAAADSITAGLMAAGPATQAAAEAALAAQVSAALGTQTAAEGALATYGGTMAGGEFAGTFGATSGLSAMAGPMLAAIGPGMAGMMLSQMGFLMDGPMSPEEAVSNWEGQAKFIESMAANLERMGLALDAVDDKQFRLFGQAAKDAAGDLERLKTVAGYTDEQIEALVGSLHPMAQEFIASGQAANSLEAEVGALVRQINAAENSMALTSVETKEFDRRIGELAGRMGITGDEAQAFKDQIYRLSHEFTLGGEEAGAFGQALEQFVATTLQGVTERAGAGAEAVRGLVEAMNGAKSAAGSFTSALPRGGTVNEVGLWTGGGGGNAELGYYHQGGLVRHQGGGIVPWGWASYQELMRLASDEVLTKLQMGEYVVQAGAVNDLTLPWLDFVNQTGQPPVVAVPEPVVIQPPAPNVQSGRTVIIEEGAVTIVVQGGDLDEEKLARLVRDEIQDLDWDTFESA